MKTVFTALFLLVFSCTYAQEKIFSVVTSPAENTLEQMNISWGTPIDIKNATVEYTKAKDKEWKKGVKTVFEGLLCNTYNGIFTRNEKGEKYYQDLVFNKYNATLLGLDKNTSYKYRIIAGGDTSSVHYFKTGGAKTWSACIISDFHAYAPLYHRTKSAMDMISTVEKYNQPFEWVLHLGDITAWGGSYNFWQQMYKEPHFENYMWAGVNGNHDNMDGTNKKNTNKFFRDAAAYPYNGYKGELGVCYFFKYSDVLFIMLNNENMRSQEGLKAAQEWVKEVVTNNPAPYVVVCEHYQWFFGKDGKDSQYARWKELFDQLGVNLALSGNNHIYVSTHPLKGDKVTESPNGTVYIQTTSSDNERGSECNWQEPVKHNPDKIKFRWSEGGQTISGIHMSVSKKKMVLTLLDRNGNILDKTEVLPRK